MEPTTLEDYNELTPAIIGAAMEVHKALGQGIKFGLLINFNTVHLRDGLKWVVNGL